jgi:hypothetical protein
MAGDAPPRREASDARGVPLAAAPTGAQHATRGSRTGTDHFCQSTSHHGLPALARSKGQGTLADSISSLPSHFTLAVPALAARLIKMVALSSLLSAIAASSAALSLASALPIQPVEELFKRQSTAEIGSDGSYAPLCQRMDVADRQPLPACLPAEWKAAYPLAGAIPQPKQEWLDALAEVVKQGKIPDMPPATITDGWCVPLLPCIRLEPPQDSRRTPRRQVHVLNLALNGPLLLACILSPRPSYRDGTAPSDPRYCHQAVGCTVATDYSHAPDGYIGVRRLRSVAVADPFFAMLTESPLLSARSRKTTGLSLPAGR